MLLALTPLIGYFIATQTPDELPIGKKWFFTASAVFSVALFLFAPWWLALGAAAGQLIGWFAGLAGLLLLVLFGSGSWELSCLIAVLGLLLGTRWRTEGRPLRQLLLGCIVLAGAALLLPQLI